MSEQILVYMPVSIGLLGSVMFLWLMNWLLITRHENLGTQHLLPRQLLMFLLTISALALMIILFPMSDSTRGQVITLLSVVVTGVIALSSTTFVANIMAGLMLHVVKSFNPGDFIRVGEQFGRVTERGLFHTEIQTEDRDLMTLPNLHLATNPLTVVHKTGTIISSELSLGYDISRSLIEDLLKQAAVKTDLQDPFVLVISLGDFSVVYRICGFLPEVKNLITIKSALKKNVLDVLHENKIEIVSPSFMNQRQLTAEHKIIPQVQRHATTQFGEYETIPEEVIFDKADVAGAAENLRLEIKKQESQIDELKKIRKTLDKAQQNNINIEIKMSEEKKLQLIEALEKMSEQSESEK